MPDQESASDPSAPDFHEADGSNRIPHHHDRFFRRIFSDGRRCADFALAFSEPKIRNSLKNAPAEVLGTKFHSSKLEMCECDARFRMETEKEQQPPVVFIVEFESTTKPMEAIKKLYQYVFSSICLWLTGEEEPAATYAMFLHLDDREWPEDKRSFADMIPGLASLGEYIQNFFFTVVDMATKEPQDLICENNEVTAALLAGYFSRKARWEREDFEYWLNYIFSLPNVSFEVMTAVVAYLKSVYTRELASIVDAAVFANRLNDGAFIVETAAQLIAEEYRPQFEAIGEARGLAQGEARGLAQGKVQGKAEGMVSVLSDVLEARFGNLPNEVRERLGAAEASQIRRWAVRAIDASSLDSLINGNDKD